MTDSEYPKDVGDGYPGKPWDFALIVNNLRFENFEFIQIHQSFCMRLGEHLDLQGEEDP